MGETTAEQTDRIRRENESLMGKTADEILAEAKAERAAELAAAEERGRQTERARISETDLFCTICESGADGDDYREGECGRDNCPLDALSRWKAGVGAGLERAAQWHEERKAEHKALALSADRLGNAGLATHHETIFSVHIAARDAFRALKATPSPSIREQALREAMAAMCMGCAEGIPIGDHTKFRKQPLHVESSGRSYVCDAAPIRALLEEQGK